MLRMRVDCDVSMCVRECVTAKRWYAFIYSVQTSVVLNVFVCCLVKIGVFEVLVKACTSPHYIDLYLCLLRA